MLDLLGDVGGLFDALRASGSVIVAAYFWIKGNPLEKYLLETTFKDRTKSTKRVSDLKKLEDLKLRKPFKLSKKLLYCSRDTREKQLIDKGMKSI